MRDEKFLEVQVERARKPEPQPSTDDCELCGHWDTHLLDGLCAQCRNKYKLEEK